MVALLLAFLVAPVFTDFPGGSAGGVEWLAENHVVISVEGQVDQDGRNREANWFYFRVDGYPKQELLIELSDLAGGGNGQFGTHAIDKHTHPVYSYDGTHWIHFPAVDWDAQRLRLSFRFTPEQAPFWIAQSPPYTEREFGLLESAVGANSMLRRESAGKTVEGREIPLWTITDAATPREGKKTIWLMFRQYAGESGSSWVGDGAVRALLSESEEAAGLRRAAIWKIFPMADPDGVVHGGVRFNRKGYDLNRHWDAIDAAKEPEIAAQHGAIKAWLDAGNRIDAFLSVHTGGTEEYVEGPTPCRQLVEKLVGILAAETTFNPVRRAAQKVQRSASSKQKNKKEKKDKSKRKNDPAPVRAAEVMSVAGAGGRMSVGQGLQTEFGVCAMRMEQMTARNGKLGGWPSSEQRQQFGGELVRAMAKALQ